MPIRPQSKPAQVDSPPKIIRVRGVVVGEATENRRLKWDGEAYTETQDVIEFFPDSGDEPKELEEDAEAMCVWMPAAARWEEFSGGGSASAGFGKVTQEITAADLTATPPYLGWGLINPASFLTPVSGIDTEPATEPDDLEIGFDGDTDIVIYSTAGEVIPVDTVIQWKTLEPDGKRFVDVVHCESA